MSRTGVTVPSAFETWVKATMRVRGLSSFSYSSSSTSPRSSTGATRNLAPTSLHSICQGTMLEWCSRLVTTTSSPSPTLRLPHEHCHEIDRLGRAAHPDDGLVRRRIEEAAHFLARRLEGVGGPGGERMRGAMNVGILARVEIGDAVDHRLRLLRRRGVVEPDQRLAVDIFMQDREVAAEDMRVELAGSRDGGQRELRNVLRRQDAEIERLPFQP